MSYPSKPSTQYIKQLRYFKHKQKLATIGSQIPQPAVYDPLSSIHKLRQHATVFHQQAHEEQLNHENGKILNKLIEISKRKKSTYSQTKPAPKMITFQNPARKQRQKMITEANLKMAERLLAKESCLDHRTMRKSIEEYQQLKKAMKNNKRVLYTSITRSSLPSIDRKKEMRSENQMKRKIAISLDYTQAYNPQSQRNHMTIQ